MDSLRFDFATVRAVTNDFSNANKLGHGGFGSVYKVTKLVTIYCLLNGILFYLKKCTLNI